MGNAASDQWEGPPDAYTSAQDTNDKRSRGRGWMTTTRQSIVSSIVINKYWDVISPPPKDSTKAKIGSALTFLADFGRQRRVSLETHTIKLTSSDNYNNSPSNNVLETKQYLRISKYQDDQSYKTKYLIDLANFEIVSIDNQKRTIMYKSYDNGDEYEGSFIFEDYTAEDMNKFHEYINQIGIRFQCTSSISGGGGGGGNIFIGAKSSDSMDSKPKKDRYASIEDTRSNSNDKNPMNEPKTPTRSTIDALVGLDSVQTTSSSTSQQGEDDHTNTSTCNNGNIEEQFPVTGRTKQEIITKGFFPESAYSSPNRRRSPKKSPRRKLRQKAEAIVEGTSENVEEEHEGKATSPKSAMSNDRRATNNDAGFTAGAAAVALSVNDIISTSAATAATTAATSASSNDTLEEEEKKTKGVKLPPFLKNRLLSGRKQRQPSNSDQELAENKSSNNTTITGIAALTSPRFHSDNRSDVNTTTDIETGLIDNTTTSNEQQEVHSSTNTHGSNALNIPAPSSRKFGFCHSCFVIFVNALHTIGIIAASGMIFYGIMLYAQPVRLMVLANTIIVWAGVIFLANSSGLLGVYQICCGGICIISFSMALTVLIIMVDLALLPLLAIARGDLFYFLESHLDYVPFIDENRLEYIKDHFSWVYISLGISAFLEMMRLLALSKLKSDFKLNQRRAVPNNEELSEPLIPRD